MLRRSVPDMRSTPHLAGGGARRIDSSSFGHQPGYTPMTKRDELMNRATLIPLMLATLALFVCVEQTRAGMLIATFSDSGGPVSYQTIDTSGVNVQAFGVQGNTLAYWGFTGPGGGTATNGATGVSLFQGSTSGPLTRTDLSFPGGVYGSFEDTQQLLAFNSLNQPVLDYSVNSQPRNSAIAVGPNGQVAVSKDGQVTITGFCSGEVETHNYISILLA